jgi:hypothetical protein
VSLHVLPACRTLFTPCSVCPCSRIDAQLNKSEEDAFQEYLQSIYAKYPVTRLNYFEHNLEVTQPTAAFSCVTFAYSCVLGLAAWRCCRLPPRTCRSHGVQCHLHQVWRQLWRTCERSDVLLVVADVRHPLFHFPPSLYGYVTRLLRKPMVLVLNKVTNALQTICPAPIN